MWLVAKYKSSELEMFKNSLAIQLGSKPVFFNPKTKYQKYYKIQLVINQLYQFYHLNLYQSVVVFHI